MVLNNLPESYEHFVVQESFNPAGSFIELRTRLLNYEESCKHGYTVSDADSHVAVTTKKSRTNHIPSSKYNASPISSSGQLERFGEKDEIGCSYCEQKDTYCKLE